MDDRQRHYAVMEINLIAEALSETSMLIRKGSLTKEQVYARLYYARRDLTYIVRRLGEGQPKR